MTPTKYKVGLLGAGYILQAHAKALQEIDAVAITAVCDVSGARAQAAAASYGIPGVFTSLDMMLKAGVDAVHVLVPPQLHVDVTRQILEAGVHAFVEKPMGLDSAQCAQLVELAAQRKVKLAVNHNFLFLPGYESLRAQVKDGTIGMVDHVSLRWLYALGLIQFGPYNNWMLRAESNLLFELGPHLIAFLIDLVGPLDTLRAEASLPIDLPGGQRVFRHWSVTGRRDQTAVSLELSVAPGQADRSVRVRGHAANAHLDFDRDVYLRDEASSNSTLFDGLAAGRNGASSLREQAWANFTSQLVANFRKDPHSNPFLDSIARSVAAFYRGLPGELDSRLDGRFGVEVIRTCERIAASAGVSSVARPLPARPQLGPRAATVLVVGGTGFIGKRLVQALLAKGQRPVRSSRPPARTLQVPCSSARLRSRPTTAPGWLQQAAAQWPSYGASSGVMKTQTCCASPASDVGSAAGRRLLSST